MIFSLKLFSGSFGWSTPSHETSRPTDKLTNQPTHTMSLWTSDKKGQRKKVECSKGEDGGVVVCLIKLFDCHTPLWSVQNKNQISILFWIIDVFEKLSWSNFEERCGKYSLGIHKVTLHGRLFIFLQMVSQSLLFDVLCCTSLEFFKVIGCSEKDIFLVPRFSCCCLFRLFDPVGGWDH